MVEITYGGGPRVRGVTHIMRVSGDEDLEANTPNPSRKPLYVALGLVAAYLLFDYFKL